MSRYNIYRYTDVGAPILNGTSGSLLAVLDGVLVNGYGSITGSGWSKPLPNDTHIGCYRAPSGSRMILHVNDSASILTQGVKEAQITGYEYLLGLTGSEFGCGVGWGQFPLPGQQTTGLSGSMYIRKSSTANSSSRPWIIFADDRTMIGFVITGDSGNTYSMFHFGDIYSTSNLPDNYNCLLAAKILVGYSATINTEPTDYIFGLNASQFFVFMAKSPNGNVNSLQAHFMGDVGKTTSLSSNGYQVNVGLVQFPNPLDDSIQICPIGIGEYVGQSIRGRIRGLYHTSHPVTFLGDGQIFQGADELAGKTFMVIRPSPNSGLWLMEISNTVEVNS